MNDLYKWKVSQYEQYTNSDKVEMYTFRSLNIHFKCNFEINFLLAMKKLILSKANKNLVKL